MNVRDVTPEDWQRFEARYPSAYAYLAHRSLVYELIYLTAEYYMPEKYPFQSANITSRPWSLQEIADRREWVKGRIGELRQNEQVLANATFIAAYDDHNTGSRIIRFMIGEYMETEISVNFNDLDKICSYCLSISRKIVYIDQSRNRCPICFHINN